MKNHSFTEQELRFTAVLYAHNPLLLEYLKKNGKLPRVFSAGGMPIGAKFIERERGRNPELTPDERLVFEAILREKRLPAGGVILFDDALPIYALERAENFSLIEQRLPPEED